MADSKVVTVKVPADQLERVTDLAKIHGVKFDAEIVEKAKSKSDSGE